jgi:hypothetical protein
MVAQILARKRTVVADDVERQVGPERRSVAIARTRSGRCRRLKMDPT